MIKVKWIKAHPKFAYSKGDIGYVTPEWAEKLMDEGCVILVPTPEEVTVPEVATPAEPPAPVNTLPEDLPGREKLFAAGFDTAEKVKEVSGGDALLDVGISVAMMKKIKKYFKE
jgi:hypothetical protein